QNVARHDARDFAVNLIQLAKFAANELEQLKATLAPLDERYSLLTGAEIDQHITEVQQALNLDVNARTNFDTLRRRGRESDWEMLRVRPEVQKMQAEAFL